MLDTSGMTPFSVYRETDGIVVRNGFAGSPEQLAAQAGEGEEVLAGVDLPVGSVVGADQVILPESAPAPDVTADDVKRHAARLLSYTDWMVMRAAEPDGKPMPEEVIAWRALIRKRSAEIEAMQPIPRDFEQDHYWQEQA
jgi:hypothetical protein